MTLELGVLLAAIGFTSSFLSGLLGIGGGLVVVPLLLYVPPALGLPAFDAKTASAIGIALVTTATLSGTIANLRRGLIERTGGLTPVEVTESSPARLRVRARDGGGELPMVTFEAEPDPPHRITGIRLELGGDGEGGGPPTMDGPPLDDAEGARRIREILATHAAEGTYSGAVLLARGGRILLREGFGEADRGFPQLRPVHGSISLPHGLVHADRARNARRMHAFERHRFVAAASVIPGVSACPCDAAAVESDVLVLPGIVQENERIAAEPAFHRQQHAFRGCDRDRCIERIAAALHDRKADKSRCRMRGPYHAAHSESLRVLLCAAGFRDGKAPRAVVNLHVYLVPE